MWNVDPLKKAGLSVVFAKVLADLMKIGGFSMVTCTTRCLPSGRNPDILTRHRHGSGFPLGQSGSRNSILFTDSDVPVTGLGAQYCQEVRDLYFFYVVCITSWREPLVVLLHKRDGKSHNCFHEIYKHGVTAHNSGHLICSLSRLESFSPEDFYLGISNNETNKDV